jgi:hypothetical protein
MRHVVQTWRGPRSGGGLIGADICTALSITAESSTPVLAMCRKLVAAGHGPESRLNAYRGATLCLRIRSIGEAAALELNARGAGFCAYRAVRTAPSMRQIGGR